MTKFKPKTKTIKGEPHLSLDWLHDQFGKPGGYEPTTWTNSPLFWGQLAQNDWEVEDVLVEDGDLWCSWDLALDYAATLHSTYGNRVRRDFLHWLGEACQASEDASVATRMRLHGESASDARAIVRRYR